jgi:hypothetical protein
MGFEMLTVVKISNAVTVGTPYSLVHGYVCSGRALWFYCHTSCEGGDTMSYYDFVLPL